MVNTISIQSSQITTVILPRIILPLDNRIIIGETNTLDLYCYEDTDGDGVSDKKTSGIKEVPVVVTLNTSPVASSGQWITTTHIRPTIITV